MTNPTVTTITYNLPSLRNPELKVARAGEHLNRLQVALNTFEQSKPYKLIGYEDLEKREYVIRVEFDTAPLSLALDVGDFVSCLRASLDQLAFQLALLKTVAPDRDTAFPVCETEDGFAHRTTRNKVQDIRLLDAIDQIKALQPYMRGKDFQTHPLWQLNRLCNLDKHKIIPIHSTWFEPKFPSAFGPIIVRHFENYDEVRLPLAAKGKVNLDPTAPMKVVFGEWKSNFEVPATRLPEIYNFVRNEVLPTFARFFS